MCSQREEQGNLTAADKEEADKLLAKVVAMSDAELEEYLKRYNLDRGRLTFLTR